MANAGNIFFYYSIWLITYSDEFQWFFTFFNQKSFDFNDQNYVLELDHKNEFPPDILILGMRNYLNILILENQAGTDLGNDLRYLCAMTSLMSQVFLLYVWYYFKVVGEDRVGGTENNILEHWFHMVPQVWPHLWTLSFHMCAQWAKKVEWVSCNVGCINLNLYWVKWSYQNFCSRKEKTKFHFQNSHCSYHYPLLHGLHPNHQKTINVMLFKTLNSNAR